MSREEILENSSILIIGGSETTATLLSGATYYLLKHPDALQKLTKEVRDTFPFAENMTFSSLAKVPYLHACIEESLRMYPPVPGLLPRRTGKEGDVINGMFIPGEVSATLKILQLLFMTTVCNVDLGRCTSDQCKSFRA